MGIRRVAVLCVSIGLILAGIVIGTAAWSGTADDGSAGDIEMGAGYRWFGTTGSPRAEEYLYQRDSWTLDGSAAFLIEPHRLFLDAEFRNNEDYFADGAYGFRDLLLLRVVNSTGFHNLDNITLWDLDPGTPTPGVDVRDSGQEYGMNYSLSRGSLRIKAPNFPLHLYAGGDLIHKDRTMQQRTLLGSGLFNNRIRTSQKRNIDWQTLDYRVGVNSHLGPVEVDVAYREKRFEPSDDTVVYDHYTQAEAGPLVVRNAGTYPHNLVPETKGQSGTVKIHTSHAGKIVAAATFTVKDRNNKTSGADADIFVGNGAVTWSPTTKLSFFVRYSHRELDLHNPGSVAVADANDPTNTYGDAEVRPSVSSITDTVSVMGRFRLIRKTTLRTTYEYRDHRRDDAAAWHLPDSTHRHTFSISADTRLIKNMNANLEYRYRTVSDPAYNNEPDDSNGGKVTLTWTPLPGVIAMGQYRLQKETRDNLLFLDAGAAIEGPDDRDVTKDQILASLTLLVLKDLSVTGTYAYMHNKTEQDIVYDSSEAPFPALVDEDVPYKGTSFHYGLDVRYSPIDRLSLNGGVGYTLTRGIFSPGAPDLTQPANIASFSRLKVRETAYSVSGEYDVMEGLRLLMDYRYTSFNDVENNPYDDVSDGTVQMIWFGLSKKLG